MFDIKAAIATLTEGRSLQRDEARDLFDFIVSGEATGPQIGALLMGLRMKGETIDEIVGAVDAMRGRMVRVEVPIGAVDIVGTGGDGSGTYNVSTCAAFIVSGAGVPVAKHGNRKLSSKSGAADVLTALGVNIELDPAGVSRCVEEAGIGFMFAPAHHPALRHVMPARIDLAIRTVFNILGPMLNPAGVRRHMIGVYSAEWLEPIARSLGELGSERALVVHGSDGLDELTTTGPSAIASLENGAVESYEITPEQLGLSRADPADLKGGDGAENAAALRRVLEGEAGAYADIALLNAAGGLMAAGTAASWDDAMDAARASVEGGDARAALDRLIEVSNGAS